MEDAWVTGAAGDAASDLNELRRRKLGSIVANELIYRELARFLRNTYGGTSDGSLLDLGAGTKPYSRLYERYFCRCVSVDVDYSPHDIGGIDTLASADDLPFADELFDCVICTEVLEHCADPRQVLVEMRRVLKPGGRAFITTPFLVPLHEMPHDYYRFTPSGLSEVAASAGLGVLDIVPRGDYFAVALAIGQWPVTKLWHALSRILRRPVYRYSNPLVFITVVLPQLIYLTGWRLQRARLRRRPSKALGPLAHFTLGYVTTLERPG
jgi:SAM-dependent methyltransferase